MSEVISPTLRTELKRGSRLGSFDRATIYQILDKAFVCHIGFTALDTLSDGLRKASEPVVRLYGGLDRARVTPTKSRMEIASLSPLEFTGRLRPALQIQLCCFQQFVVVVLALTSAPFGMPATAFWIYVCASLLFIIGLIKIFGELPQEHGVDKIMPFGRLFFAIPIAVFGSEHFTATANIATLVPSWIPAHTFWVYLVGLAFLCAALSIAVLVQARLAAALVGMTLLIFVFVVDMPAVIANPRNRFFWALALRELAFSGGAFAFAMSPWSARPRQPSRAQPTAALAAIPRFFVGFSSLFYGVEHLLHPAYVPGIPLQKLTPEWIPGRIFLSYFVGVILILAGVCLLVNKKTRMAAMSLGLTILLTVLWIYLPMLLAAPTDVVALNYFFDTLLFCGAILLLASATDKKQPGRGLNEAPHRSTNEMKCSSDRLSKQFEHGDKDIWSGSD